MTNAQTMTKLEVMTNDKCRGPVLRHSSFVILSSFVIRASSFLFSSLPLGLHAADNLGVLGSKPKWEVLENYQRTITHDEFAHLVNDVYCTHGFAADLIKIDNDAAQIVTNREAHDVFTLRFAPDPSSTARVPRLWRPAKSL